MHDERYICNFDFIIENYYYSEHRISNDDTIYTYDGLDNVNMTLSTTGSIQKKYEYSDYGQRSLDSKTEIINNEFVQKYVDPRNISPSVIEDAILNTTSVPGKMTGTFVHQTVDVTVVVNETGKVVTVIPK